MSPLNRHQAGAPDILFLGRGFLQCRQRGDILPWELDETAIWSQQSALTLCQRRRKTCTRQNPLPYDLDWTMENGNLCFWWSFIVLLNHTQLKLAALTACGWKHQMRQTDTGARHCDKLRPAIQNRESGEHHMSETYPTRIFKIMLEL